jgi:hypothetical protein
MREPFHRAVAAAIELMVCVTRGGVLSAHSANGCYPRNCSTRAYGSSLSVMEASAGPLASEVGNAANPFRPTTHSLAGADTGDLMGNDQMLLSIDCCLHIVPTTPVPRVIIECASGWVSETCLPGEL